MEGGKNTEKNGEWFLVIHKGKKRNLELLFSIFSITLNITV